MTVLGRGSVLRAGLSVGEVADAAGIAQSAVRFYEQRGLISAGRDSRNQRRFSGAAACRIRVAKLAQRVGLSIGEIAALFAQVSDDPAPHEWEFVATALTDAAQARVDGLRAALADLGSGVRLCELPSSPSADHH